MLILKTTAKTKPVLNLITLESGLQKWTHISDSARHQSQDICPPISQNVLKNFIKISLIIKECPVEILRKKTGNCPEDFKV